MDPQTPEWMIYNGTSYVNGWFRGPRIFGNLRVENVFGCLNISSSNQTPQSSIDSGCPIAIFDYQGVHQRVHQSKQGGHLHLSDIDDLPCG